MDDLMWHQELINFRRLNAQMKINFDSMLLFR